jgi:hypothetical protein
MANCSLLMPPGSFPVSSISTSRGSSIWDKVSFVAGCREYFLSSVRSIRKGKNLSSKNNITKTARKMPIAL